jgi:replicative DNA helicase
MRLLCSLAKVDAQNVKSGHVTENDWNALSNAANELLDAPIYIDDTPGIGIFEMRSKARRLKANYDISILIVDYLQLMRGWDNRVESRQQEVSQISQFLKSLAKELDIPVIALSQLSRRIETQGNRKPVLSDLRESGALEQDADIVCFLYRPSNLSMDEDGFEENSFVVAPTLVTELIIGKQRNGPIGTVRLIFRSKYASFENLDMHSTPSAYDNDEY